jgi:two-component system NtrC family response regulator
MNKASDNQTRAADMLGMSERMLRYKLKKYDLKN